jgi:hypothetical protein
MSELIFIDEHFRDAVRKAIHELARHPRSIANDVIVFHFDEVLEAACLIIDPTYEDMEASVVIALGKLKLGALRHCFIKRKMLPSRRTYNSAGF